MGGSDDIQPVPPVQRRRLPNGSGRVRSARVADTNTFHIDTEDDPTASPLLAFLSVRGEVRWNSGRATCMLAPARLTFSANGGGRIYGAMARGGPMVFRGLRQPLSFYALNVERVNENPQSIFDDCQNVRIYFFKVEAGTINRPGNLDANTPCRIVNSENIRVYCMYGNVRRLGDRAMMEVIDSDDVQISQLKSFQSEGFPQLMERRGDSAYEIDSRTSCALFLREASE